MRIMTYRKLDGKETFHKEDIAPRINRQILKGRSMSKY